MPRAEVVQCALFLDLDGNEAERLRDGEAVKDCLRIGNACGLKRMKCAELEKAMQETDACRGEEPEVGCFPRKITS